MSNKVRVARVDITSLKNVLNGTIVFPIYKHRSFSHADILGIYGQNGSGKTAVVDAFEILHSLLHGVPLPKRGTPLLINQDSDTASLGFTFYIELANSAYELYYNVEIRKFESEDTSLDALESGERNITAHISKEEVRYKQLIKGARPKTAIAVNWIKDEYTISPTALHERIKSGKDDSYVSYRVNSQLAFKERTSFLFRKEGLEILKKFLPEETYELLGALKNSFANNLFVFSNQQSSLALANVLIPLHFKKKGESGYGLTTMPSDKAQVMPVEHFDLLTNMFRSISKVLKELIPGLTVELRSLGSDTLKDGTIGVRAQIMADRNGKSLPISSESDGIKKLISILSSLIVMYNDPNACVVIDELDAGIFEFLLGEIVRILNDNGIGQLLFTSHNLRLLEVLEKDNLVFTTTNPKNRFINLRGIKDTNNIRDVYIRAIQLGNDDESVYEETDRYYIMDAFEEAGGVYRG